MPPTTHFGHSAVAVLLQHSAGGLGVEVDDGLELSETLQHRLSPLRQKTDARRSIKDVGLKHPAT